MRPRSVEEMEAINEKMEFDDLVLKGAPKNPLIESDPEGTLVNCAQLADLLCCIRTENFNKQTEMAVYHIGVTIRDALMWEAEGKTECIESIGPQEKNTEPH